MNAPALPRPWSLDLKTAAIWALLAGLSALAIMPYLLRLMPDLREAAQVPLPAFVLIQVVQAMLLAGLLSLLGLRMGHRVGMGSPLMQAWLGGTASPDARSLRPLQAIGLGVCAAAAIIGASLALDRWLPEPLYAIEHAGRGQTALNGFLAAFYGGIVEELVARLFVLTLIVWLLCGFGRRTPSPAIVWTAIMLAALLFGAGHLPPAVELWGLSPLVVFRTVALNAVAAVVFGWLYWRRGIEMAMLGHFSADIVVHVIAPLVLTQPPA